jgi:hypothetical protein
MKTLNNMIILIGFFIAANTFKFETRVVDHKKERCAQVREMMKDFSGFKSNLCK